MQVYLSKYLTEPHAYRKRVFRPIVCSIVLMLLIPSLLGFVLAGRVLSAGLQWLISLSLLLLVIGACSFLYPIAKIAYRDALVFCQDKNGCLYGIDIRESVPAYQGRHYWKGAFAYRFFRGLWEIDRILERIRTEGLTEADLEENRFRVVQIDDVLKLQKVPEGRFLVCTTLRDHVRTGTRKYDISHHSEALFALLMQRNPSHLWDTAARTYTIPIFISALLIVLCLGICIASHASVGILPEALYFPFLFAIEIPIIALGIFILKGRKGE